MLALVVVGIYVWADYRIGTTYPVWSEFRLPASTGSDEFGRDLIAVVVLSSLNSLLYGLICSLVAVSIASFMAYMIVISGSWLLSRLVDIGARIVDGVPVVMWVLLLALLAPAAPRVVATVVFLAAVVPYLTRVLAGEFSRLSRLAYIEAARLQELPPWKLLIIHLLPNSWAILAPSIAQVCGLAIAVDAAIALTGSANRTELNLGVLLLRSKEQFSHPQLMVAALGAMLLVYGVISAIVTNVARRPSSLLI